MLNCPFAKFPPTFNYVCIGADQLESAEAIADEELLTQKKFQNAYQVLFVSYWLYLL